MQKIIAKIRQARERKALDRLIMKVFHEQAEEFLRWEKEKNPGIFEEFVSCCMAKEAETSKDK